MRGLFKYAVLLCLITPANAQWQSAPYDAREYLALTATPGYTMTKQGVHVALACLHPEFAHRLAWAIHDARQSGLHRAGVFSACRPPILGVGGFADKFDSLHAYGLAVDMAGIGRPGSDSAKLFHEIARRNGVVCVYGADHRAEWNHCQAVDIKRVTKTVPLRETITKHGPMAFEWTWATAQPMIFTREAAEHFAIYSPPKRVKVAKTKKSKDTKYASKKNKKSKYVKLKDKKKYAKLTKKQKLAKLNKKKQKYASKKIRMAHR